MRHVSTLQAILTGDPARWRILGLVGSLGLPDCWIGAGFVRNAAWDHAHGRPASCSGADIDVIWFDRGRADASEDSRLEATLRALDPAFDWSVKNQARMHSRNGDAPYASATDAMRYWPETATAVAARRTLHGVCEIAAPLGLDDLFDLRLRPTSKFASERRDLFQDRIDEKGWLNTWPLLRVVST
jgi:uncharacterized protein